MERTSAIVRIFGGITWITPAAVCGPAGGDIVYTQARSTVAALLSALRDLELINATRLISWVLWDYDSLGEADACIVAAGTPATPFFVRHPLKWRHFGNTIGKTALAWQPCWG
ncbi:hypothetical protein [Blastomonas sp.]|uniref:hypothetical protein n=1 Tax=Blastomonas sp. TaxID=1909299 RepID=UPI002607C972|nr:hypothetical protein [Blastomonas sp.]MDM7955948.1 hypothetical protein [Blastomonas sp.]